ncbi:hypothetical protein [Kordia jejudonensis]|uniref:hypothetical protein n=1 Tax=Kordia jejudonensis TaxID=1348245 RepID=UPI0012DFEB57|nr:hypothetical protein [Kordia jejudonensis]
MKRVYKVILLFLAIFVIGILSFGSYINSSLKKEHDTRAVDIQKDSIKNAAVDTYYLN